MMTPSEVYEACVIWYGHQVTRQPNMLHEPRASIIPRIFTVGAIIELCPRKSWTWQLLAELVARESHVTAMNYAKIWLDDIDAHRREQWVRYIRETVLDARGSAAA